MAMLSPADVPSIIKVRSEPMKKYVLSKLGYPQVAVEISEDQWETIFRIAGDFIAGYFPREQKLAVFWTTPLQSTYPFPTDAYWIQEVKWDPIITRIDDIFGMANMTFNIGNLTGNSSILTDYHLIQSYIRTSQKILGTEGHWEVLNEGQTDAQNDNLSSKDQLLRLYPTPKGAFPVTVLYVPVVTHFRSPQARMITYELMLAEAKIAVGAGRRKISGIPTPDGGTISYDGAELVQEGEAAREKILTQAIQLGEPLSPAFW